MNTIYAIRQLGGCIIERNGRQALYSTRELAEEDLRSMPDSWTDYDHFEVIELTVATESSELIFKVQPGFRNEELNK